MKEQWRAELKYTVGTAESRMLAARMASFMERDIHGGKTGYLVRSLYFDNFYNKALREKLDGVGVREKLRIRCYDGNFGFIRLEKKSKRYNAGNKIQCRVTAEETKRILDGDIGWMAEDERALVRELYLRMQMGIYRPTVIVDYDREALTYAPGNVRVTSWLPSAPVIFLGKSAVHSSHFPGSGGHGSEIRRLFARYCEPYFTDVKNKRTGFFQVCSLPHHVLMDSEEKKT